MSDRPPDVEAFVRETLGTPLDIKRHDVPERHEFGEAFLVPEDHEVSAVGPGAHPSEAGILDKFSRVDHVHEFAGSGTGGGGVTDHGALTGLADDDHPQYTLTAEAQAIADGAVTTHVGQADPHPTYVTAAEGNAAYAPTAHNHDHGVLTGLADDDHPQYHNDTRGDARYVNISGDTMTGILNAGNFQIKTVGAPSAITDAANKGYVDNLISAIPWKEPCRLATTANINTTTNGLAAIDGVTPVANDRILVKNQTNGAQNGIYLAAATAWTRPADADGVGEMEGCTALVLEGTTQADTVWMCTTNGSIVVGSTVTTWAQLGGSSGVTDHGLLTGLGDDDHPQYHNDARGDAKYSALAHNHDSSYLSPSEVLAGTNVTVDTVTTPGSVIVNSTGSGGTSDHGALTGLADDDHPQYLKPTEVIAGTNITVDTATTPGSVIVNSPTPALPAQPTTAAVGLSGTGLATNTSTDVFFTGSIAVASVAYARLAVVTFSLLPTITSNPHDYYLRDTGNQRVRQQLANSGTSVTLTAVFQIGAGAAPTFRVAARAAAGTGTTGLAGGSDLNYIHVGLIPILT